MEAIFYVGMSDSLVGSLTQINPGLLSFALDLYSRFILQYGVLVYRIPPQRYENILQDAHKRYPLTCTDNIIRKEKEKLSRDGLLFVITEFKRFTHVPENPMEQLKMIIEAIYSHSYIPNGKNPIVFPEISGGVSIIVQVNRESFSDIDLWTGNGLR